MLCRGQTMTTYESIAGAGVDEIKYGVGEEEGY